MSAFGCEADMGWCSALLLTQSGHKGSGVRAATQQNKLRLAPYAIMGKTATSSAYGLLFAI